MATIIIILIIWGIFHQPKSRRKRRSTLFCKSLPTEKPINQTAIIRAQEKRKQEAIRAAKERERQIALAEKARQRKQQAEADKAFYLQQLERVSEMLNTADTELARIETQIEIDIATRSYDSEIRDRKAQERILNKIMQYETRIHNLEARLAKANYILQEV